MKKKTCIIAMMAMAFASANAIDVNTIRTAGPFSVMEPLVIDSINAAQQKYSAPSILDTQVSLDLVKDGLVRNLNGISARSAGGATEKNGKASSRKLMLAGFTFTLSKYTKAEVKVSGPSQYAIYVNGKAHRGKTAFQCGSYDVVIKYVTDTADIKISVNAEDEKAIAITDISGEQTPRRPFSLDDNMQMKQYNSVKVSPSGKYAIVGSSWYDAEGASKYKSVLIESATGKELRPLYYNPVWMSKSDRFYYTKQESGKTQLIVVDPATFNEEVLYNDLPSASFTMSPTEDYIIISKVVKGPNKENGVYEIINPEDRQPGWRDRTSLSKMDLATGLVQPLTYNDNNVWLMDISKDGQYIIFGMQTQDLSKRPTLESSVYRMNVNTLETEKLIDKDGFINNVSLIPGTEKLAIVASAEAFKGIGRNLPDNMTPNIFEHQLYIFDMKTKKVDPVTKYFNPSVNTVFAANASNVYFTAENADSVSLYRLDMKTYKIQAVKQPCEVISGCDLSDNGSTLVYYGSGACVAPRLYTLNTKNHKVAEIGDINKDMMAEIKIGTCEAWRFKSKNGYELTGHAYLPADLDPNKKYPMIVHYYGGCSPTSRRFGGGSHYPAHYWNALGYVVLIVNPGGASGFGQEWGARHVNTAGEGIAEDIIEATEWFTDTHKFVNKDRIGCVSASYGGFMSQLLLTKTDLFACGISHAGISDHSSYWGEGYWGYTYSEVSMANSYPWTRKDLFVDRSPLFNADKIHKPLLFTHGSADTNVPIGESIQMYTALKLLGVPTAFIVVEGENHGIMNYHKRIKWINSMLAWFDKYLKDEPAWWDAIYTPKKL